jgi:hypothetical protein
MNTLQEALFQITEPIDFDALTAIVKDLTPEEACRVLPGMPYSVATNLHHAVIWQEHWLAFCRGEAKSAMGDDWRSVDPGEWDALCDQFVRGQREALALSAQPDIHQDIQRRLLRIAMHGAYHVGQIQLLVRFLDADRGASVGD